MFIFFHFATENIWAFLPAVFLISFLIAYFGYKRSNIENPSKLVLQLLRFSTTFLILLLLLNPFLYLTRFFQDKPLNFVLIDNSASLKIEDRYIKVKEYLLKNSDAFINSNSETKFFLFSGNSVKEINKDDLENLNFFQNSGFETNYSQTLEDVFRIYSQRNISTINIISDGIINAGVNPAIIADKTETIFNYYLIGDTIQKKDLLIYKTEFNRTAYIQSNTPLKINIRSFGYNNTVTVQLFEDNILVGTKTPETNLKEKDYYLNFLLNSYTEGTKKYRIEIIPLGDEVTTLNNTEEFYIKYVDNKLKVCVLSGGPSPDFAYVSQEVKKIDNFKTDFFTQKTSNSFYEGMPAELKDYKIIILCGFPTAITDITLMNQLKEKLSKGNTGILFISGSTVDYQKLSLIQDYLPFVSNLSNTNEVATGLRAITFYDAEKSEYFNAVSGINSFPRVFKPFGSVTAKPTAETILLFSESSEPAVITNNTPENKSAGILFYGFYKWRLNPNSKNPDEVLNSLISGSVLSITDKEKNKRFNIETDKQIYSPDENIVFKVNTNETDLTSTYQVKLKVFNNNLSKVVDLERKDEFYSEGKIRLSDTGEYSYSAELISNGSTIENQSGKFMVGDSRIEYKKTNADDSFLKQLIRSKGSVLNDISKDKIREDIDNISKTYSDTKEIKNKLFLNENAYLLIFILLLYSIEWYLRKRKSLP